MTNNNNNSNQNGQQLNLALFDFNISANRKQKAINTRHDIVIGYRVSGKDRKNTTTDISLTNFVSKTGLKYQKVAIGVSKIRKQSTIIMLFDNPSIADCCTVNHYNTTGGHQSCMISSRGAVLKMMEALGCIIPDKEDAQAKVYCCLEESQKDIYVVKPLYVEYHSGDGTTPVRVNFDENGMLPRKANPSISVTKSRF